LEKTKTLINIAGRSSKRQKLMFILSKNICAIALKISRRVVGNAGEQPMSVSGGTRCKAIIVLPLGTGSTFFILSPSYLATIVGNKKNISCGSLFFQLNFERFNLKVYGWLILGLAFFMSKIESYGNY